ncbi:MAG: hypothetical protein QQW96_18670 [Tychonema bourrellyi B0820]|nr:hypothetical protein [Tychonema bourrellyi B0820]
MFDINIHNTVINLDLADFTQNIIGQQSTVNSQQSTVNSQQSTVNSQQT